MCVCVDNEMFVVLLISDMAIRQSTRAAHFTQQLSNLHSGRSSSIRHENLAQASSYEVRSEAVCKMRHEKRSRIKRMEMEKFLFLFV